MNKQYFCFSLKLAGWLMIHGFVLFEVKRDMHSKRNVYVFNNSEQLKKSIESYKLNNI